MGSLSSIVSGVTSAVSAVKSVASIVENPQSLNPLNTQSKLLAQEQSLALKQLQQKQAVDTQDLEAQSTLQQQQITAQAQSDADQRQAALRRAVARQQAAFGAQGISPDDGSSEAVLLGLYQQTDQEQEDAGRLDNLRSAAIDQNLSDQNNLNVLARTQLIQRQNLEKVAEGF